MARYTGPKRRLSRREGIPLTSKDIKALERKGAVPPGQIGTRRKGKLSEYGVQLREKQKAKRLFGLMEKQFRGYFEKAGKVKGETGTTLLRLLETRLDNVVYKLGLAKSRAAARQFVSHGHISVDGKKINIPSYNVKQEQTVALSPRLSDNIQDLTLPEWLDRKATVGKVLRYPNREEGSAITSVKIDGVAHQFSTIEGVSEDVIEIILNLKKVRVKVHSDKPIKLKLSVSGKKEVTARDIEIVGDGEIANPDQPIATLSGPKAKLTIEMEASRGKGYVGAEEKSANEIGVIPIDALFSPIISVNYRVESARVGRKANFDKLVLEVATDGTIEPAQALEQAGKILSDTFKQIYEPTAQVEEEIEQTGVVSDEVLKMSVEELDLPVRITNALRVIDINTVEDLINTPRQQLLKAKNLGAKSLSLISEKLFERGLALREA
ncbi:MAG: DNA-directed RNA polymerase subunit alpha [Microgenomates group bacterium Gr01-1014_80]|nr:MAG: DNA-directed RNA polymerase subunit alpha [Microgenomates group bacterium Gr01-1014_80]